MNFYALFRGGGQCPKNLKHDFEIIVDPKGLPSGSTFWLGFETHMGAREDTPIFRPMQGPKI